MRSARIAFGRWFANAFVPRFFPLVNPLVRWILRSRLHRLLSWYVAVVRVQGLRTGNTYDVPFTFHRVDATTIECLTSRQRLWWRNLCQPADAQLLYRGTWRPATAVAITNDAAIADALARRDWPRRALMPLPPSDAVLVRVTLVE
jgi:hypothetical protein